MPDYHFNARDAQGKAVSGQRSALNAEDLASQLINTGLMPIEIVAINETPRLSLFKTIPFFKPQVPISELQIFCRQTYSLLHAGIPIATVLSRLAETARDKTLGNVFSAILQSLNKGSSLYAAMAQFPDLFSEFFLNLILIGEKTGDLDSAFLHLSEYLELESDITKKIKKSLRYPIFVLVAMFCALLVINFFVVPAFSNLYSSFHGELPLPTRILVGMSQFMIGHWFILLVASLSSFLRVRAYVQSPKGSLQWGRWQLKMPLIGWLIHRILLARFARLLSLVLRAGVPAVESIEMVGASTGNVYVAKKINDITDLIVRGNTISSAVAKTGFFPPLVIQMIMLGEESGTIEKLLDEVADYYQGEIDFDIARLTESIEPIILILMAVMVLVLALGVFLPMWNMTSLIK